MSYFKVCLQSQHLPEDTKEGVNQGRWDCISVMNSKCPAKHLKMFGKYTKHETVHHATILIPLWFPFVVPKILLRTSFSNHVHPSDQAIKSDTRTKQQVKL